MYVSQLKVFSIGIVAVNKALDSDTIEVTPIEYNNFVDGEVTDNTTLYEATGVDEDGRSYQKSLDTTTTIKAKWLPIGITNRRTPPDVRRGERVVLYQYAEQDKFYWTTLFYDMKLRKLETVIYTYSATRDEDKDAAPDTTYFLEVSTHKKLITFHTCKADGEPFAYDIQLNTKDGVFTITDDIGNYIQLDSKNVRIEVKNADGSHLDMNRKVITMTAPDTINLNAGNNINMKAGKIINSEAGTSINDKTQTITTKATTTTNTVPNTSFSGNISVGGNAAVAGMTTTKGLTSVSGGSFSVAGSGTFQGTVNVNKLISSTNIQAPNVS